MERLQPDPSPFEFLRVDGLAPADEAEAELLYRQVTLSEPELLLLACHHQDNESYLAFHDSSMTWDIPGSPQYLAVHITRDQEAGTFRYAGERLPLLPLAQQWLTARGCPAPSIRTLPDLPGAEAADSQTTALEAQLAASPGRYDLLDHYTDDQLDHQTWVLLRDRHPTAAAEPYRVLLEEVDFEADHYTLREGAFATDAAARQWLENRSGPLPPPDRTTTASPPRPPGTPPRSPGRRR